MAAGASSMSIIVLLAIGIGGLLLVGTIVAVIALIVANRGEGEER